MRKKRNTPGNPEKPHGLRPLNPPLDGAAAPLSRLQHALAGALILVVLILLTIAAVSINHWRKQHELGTSSGNNTSAPTETQENPNETDDPESSPTVIRSGDPLEVPLSARSRSTFIVGIDETVDIINPLYSSSDGEKDLVSLIFEPLVRYTQQGDVLGVLADRWHYDEQNRQLVFTLRPGHFFRDGRAVESTDIIHTYQSLISDSYNGPHKGRFHDIVSIQAGENESEVVFQFSEDTVGPDYRLFTIGILKHDYYTYDMDNVFMMAEDRLPPEGSGAYRISSFSEDSVEITLRDGYAGSIRDIHFEKIASEDKLDQLRNGMVDLVRNRWDARMQVRAASLGAYDFYPSATRIDAYLMTGRQPDAASPLNQSEMRRDILLAISGQPLSPEQKARLTAIDQSIDCLYFLGVDNNVSANNLDALNALVMPLYQLGLNIRPVGVDWPEMAAKAESGEYELMLMPAPSNNRLPAGTILLGQSADEQSEHANAWAAIWHDEVIIVSARLLQLTINENGHPLSISTASWTDRLENVRFYNYEGVVS